MEGGHFLEKWVGKMIEKYVENSMIQVGTKTNRPKQGLMIVH
jgi:hypothetical protein